MTSQTMLAGMKFSITGTSNSHEYPRYPFIKMSDRLVTKSRSLTMMGHALYLCTVKQVVFYIVNVSDIEYLYISSFTLAA